MKATTDGKKGGPGAPPAGFLRDPAAIGRVLEGRVLPFVDRPGRYIGGEINAVLPGPPPEVRVLLSYPDLYEVGMSNHGLRILAETVRSSGFARPERAFAFREDMAAAALREGVPLYSLESLTPASDFDLWGFSLQAELTYTNIPAMIEAAGLAPDAASRRWPGTPLLVGGGVGAYNPEPLSRFFDLFVIGDGEEALREILDFYRERRGRPGADKESFLAGLAAAVPGVYVPSLYRETRDGEGNFAGLLPRRAEVPAFVPKRVLKDLGQSRVSRPIVPLVDVVHNRAVVEIMRGCARGCRFCQAGWAGRPVREKPPETAAAEALEQVEATGCDEVSLLSLSSGDYRRIDGLLELLAPLLAARGVGVSLPSLNAASISEGIFRQLKRVRKSGITLAPEAGSVRMRKTINKELAPEVLDEVVRQAKEQGWRLLKLYFMIGLPGEEDEDVEAAAALVNRLSRWGGDLNVTVSNFVPKAQTPFQWAPMTPPDELKRKQAILRARISSRRVKLKFRDPRMSCIEGLFAVGGREAGRLVEEAYRRRCLFADWRERFDPGAWEAATAASGIDLDRTLFSPRAPERPLPWAHIGGGVPGEVLLREYRRAEEASR